MSKRKRPHPLENASPRPVKQSKISPSSDHIYIQVVTGSYERVLHGITVAIPQALLQSRNQDSDTQTTVSNTAAVSFTDCFLLNAHTSSIKCLAISPSPPASSPSQKLILATGSTDEKINLFHLSTRVPRGPALPSLGSTTQENIGNRSLGTLNTHNASITALHFPNRSKLLSSCGNNVIAVTSTRTFNTLSIMKAPNPKHPNRPTGDTSTTSTLPNGVNDFAVHPSMKLMISVGRAERSMRLWNLVTGKKAGVLSFEKEMLTAIGENVSRWGSGEGHKVLWSPDGTEFAICFERGICIFGTNCEPIAIIASTPSTKLHQVRYLPQGTLQTLAVSTEDGRLLFYSSAQVYTSKLQNGNKQAESNESLPKCRLLGQLGGRSEDIQGRIKDFHVLNIQSSATVEKLLITTAGSDGSIRLWLVDPEQFTNSSSTHKTPLDESKLKVNGNSSITQVGNLLGTYSTNNRITCVISFELSAETDETQASDAKVHEDALDDEDEERNNSHESGTD